MAEYAAESKRKRIERRIAAMKSERSEWEPHWRELAEYFVPRRGRWSLSDRNKGDKRNQKIIDATPRFAARVLASGMMAGLTSPARPWFKLTTPDPKLRELGAVKQWLSAVEQAMRDVFAKSNLYNALPTLYGELGVFGTGAMLALEDQDDVVRFYPMTVGRYWLATSAKGEVDTMYREIPYTVRQLVQEFGFANVSSGCQAAFERGEYENTVDVIHAIEPNDERLIGRMDAAGMAWRSCYYEVGTRDGDKLLAERGYRESPILAPRWDVLSEETYGSSPGMDALGDSKALQFQQKRKAIAIDKMIDPPLVGPTALRNQRVSLLPGDVTYVDINQVGAGLKSIYDVRLDPSMLLEDTREIQDRVNTAFYADLFLMLAMSDRRQITAREIEERHEEKLLMLGPVLERLNDELLDPMIDRTFAIMLRAGLIPEPPRELEGVDLKVEYISILAQAQKAIGIAAVDKLTIFVANAMAINPDSADKLDLDQAIDEYGDALGVSPSIVRSDDAVAELRAARQQQQQAMQVAAMAQPAAQAASAVKSLGDTQVTPGSALARMMGGAAAGAPSGPA